jgi:hypothetical protein
MPEMLDLENVQFKNFKVRKAKDPDYIYVAARITGNVDASRKIDTYVYLDIWNADEPSIEALQLRVIDAISKSFSLSPAQREKALPANAKATIPAIKRSSDRGRGSRTRKSG